MIKRGAGLQVTRVPLSLIVVTEHQVRYPDKLNLYIKLCLEHPEDDPGVIFLKRMKNVPGVLYEILDGHHKFCALIMTGRIDALCLIIEED
jgi:hypothetical protein